MHRPSPAGKGETLSVEKAGNANRFPTNTRVYLKDAHADEPWPEFGTPGTTDPMTGNLRVPIRLRNHPLADRLQRNANGNAPIVNNHRELIHYDQTGHNRHFLRVANTRTRGDEPIVTRFQDLALACSPHARGWTVAEDLERADVVVFPARAGMDRNTLRDGPLAAAPDDVDDGLCPTRGSTLGNPHCRRSGAQGQPDAERHRDR